MAPDRVSQASKSSWWQAAQANSPRRAAELSTFCIRTLAGLAWASCIPVTRRGCNSVQVSGQQQRVRANMTQVNTTREWDVPGQAVDEEPDTQRTTERCQTKRHLFRFPTEGAPGRCSYLSLQHQLLGEQCGFLTEGFSFLHQAWQVAGSPGALDPCNRTKELTVRRGPCLGHQVSCHLSA